MTDPCVQATVQIDAGPVMVYRIITDPLTPASPAEQRTQTG